MTEHLAAELKGARESRVALNALPYPSRRLRHRDDCKQSAWIFETMSNVEEARLF